MAVGELWLDCNYDEEGKLVYDQDSHRQVHALPDLDPLMLIRCCSDTLPYPCLIPACTFH